LQRKCRRLATDFATRSAAHDRDASHPVENCDRLRKEGFLSLTVGKEWGGSGACFLDHTITYEVLGQGCPSTALAFNMRASVVMPLLESAEGSAETKRRIADLVVQHHKLIAGNFSEPVTTSLIGERPLTTRARRADVIPPRLQGIRFALDSPLEGTGFELPVPRQIGFTVSRPGTEGSNPSPSCGESRANLKLILQRCAL
jgi:alkylation response protein AidB-like acyl-CoA dehydrogenase